MTANAITRKPRKPRTKTYTCWLSMRERCNNKNHDHYSYYGGRGIAVCERWKSFDNFLSDMGEKPEGMTLDRRDNSGPYCPENCQWATRSQQMRNTRHNRMVTYDGVTMTVTEWAIRLGLTRLFITKRLNRGWSDEEALTTPRMKNASTYA